MSPFKAVVLSAMLATSAGAHAALVSFTGAGLQIPDGNAAGLSVDIDVLDSRVIKASGNNVTLTLLNFEHSFAFDLAVTLEHLGSSAGAQAVFDQVLDSNSLAARNALDGDYAFNSGASMSLRGYIDTFGRFDPIASGTYMPTLPDDATASELSSAWNGESAAGLWRLHLTDYSFIDVSNGDWSWRLDIDVEDSATVPEPATLPLLLAAAGLSTAWRRRRAKHR